MLPVSKYNECRTVNSTKPWRSLLLVTCLSSVVPAAELVMRDIGVGVVQLPTDFSYDVSAPAGNRSGDDTFDSAYGIDVHGRYSMARTGDSLGLVLGGALGAEQAAYAPGGAWTAFTATGLAGCGWAITDRIILLGEAQVGLGLGQLEIDGSAAANSISVSGPLVRGGVQASGRFALTESVIIGLGVGWLQTMAPLSGDGVDTTLKISGTSAFLSLDWRLSDRPFLLE